MMLEEYNNAAHEWKRINFGMERVTSLYVRFQDTTLSLIIFLSQHSPKYFTQLPGILYAVIIQLFENKVKSDSY